MLGFITSGIIMISTALLGAGGRGPMKREKPVQQAPVVKVQVVQVKHFDAAILFTYCLRDNTDGVICQDCKKERKPVAGSQSLRSSDESSAGQPPIEFSGIKNVKPNPPPQRLHPSADRVLLQEVIHAIYHPPSVF